MALSRENMMLSYQQNDHMNMSTLSMSDQSYIMDLSNQQATRDIALREEALEEAFLLFQLALERGAPKTDSMFLAIHAKVEEDLREQYQEKYRLQDERLEAALELERLEKQRNLQRDALSVSQHKVEQIDRKIQREDSRILQAKIEKMDKVLMEEEEIEEAENEDDDDDDEEESPEEGESPEDDGGNADAEKQDAGIDKAERKGKISLIRTTGRPGRSERAKKKRSSSKTVQSLQDIKSRYMEALKENQASMAKTVGRLDGALQESATAKKPTLDQALGHLNRPNRPSFRTRISNGSPGGGKHNPRLLKIEESRFHSFDSSRISEGTERSKSTVATTATATLTEEKENTEIPKPSNSGQTTQGAAEITTSSSPPPLEITREDLEEDKNDDSPEICTLEDFRSGRQQHVDDWECRLSPNEFQKHFKMSLSDFQKLPKWKQASAKRNLRRW